MSIVIDVETDEYLSGEEVTLMQQSMLLQLSVLTLWFQFYQHKYPGSNEYDQKKGYYFGHYSGFNNLN